MVVSPRLNDGWLALKFASLIYARVIFISNLLEAQKKNTNLTKYTMLVWIPSFIDTWSNYEVLQFCVGHNSNNLALTDINGTTGWELALVTTPSNQTSQAPDRKMVCVITSSLAIIYISSHTLILT